MIKKLFLPFCLLIVSVSSVQGQKLDSLKAVLDTAQAERKVKTLNEFFRAYLQSDPVKGLGYTQEALAMAIDIGDKNGIAASYNNLGVAYRNHAALDKALEYYIKSLKLYESLGNKEGVATQKNNIANIYAIKKDYSQAMHYLEESYNDFIKLGNKNKIVGSMNNLGNLNLDLQLFEKAMKYYSEAYQVSKQNGALFADPLNNMGNIHFRQGNYQKAIDNYLRALEIEEANNNRLGILNVVTNIGIAYARAGQAKPAQQYLNRAESLVKELQAYTYLPPVLK